jgi:hypothetical protein
MKHLCEECTDIAFTTKKETFFSTCDVCKETTMCQRFKHMPELPIVKKDIQVPDTKELIKDYAQAVESLALVLKEDRVAQGFLLDILRLPTQLLQSYNELWLLLANTYALLNSPRDFARSVGLCTEIQTRFFLMLKDKGLINKDGTVNDVALLKLITPDKPDMDDDE